MTVRKRCDYCCLPEPRDLCSLKHFIVAAASAWVLAGCSAERDSGASVAAVAFPIVSPPYATVGEDDAKVVFNNNSPEPTYSAFLIPAVAKGANGQLLAFAEGRLCYWNDDWPTDIVFKVRDANGTWGPLRILAGKDVKLNPDGSAPTVRTVPFVCDGWTPIKETDSDQVKAAKRNTFYNTPTVVEGLNGDIHVFYTRARQFNYYMRGRFNPATHQYEWSEAVALPMGPDLCKGNTTLMGPGRGVRLANAPGNAERDALVVPWRCNDVVENQKVVHFYYAPNPTNDQPPTWNVSRMRVIGGGNTRRLDEVAVAELRSKPDQPPSHEVYFSLRNLYPGHEDTVNDPEVDEDGDGNPAFEWRYRLESFSGDASKLAPLVTKSKGVSYTSLSEPSFQVGDTNGISAGCHASVLWLGVGNDVDHELLFSNPNSQAERRYLTIRRGLYNPGEPLTWSRGKMLTNRGSAYSSLIELDASTIGVLYESGDGSEQFPVDPNQPGKKGITADRKQLRFAQVPKAWLSEEVVAGWEFEEFAPNTDWPTEKAVRNFVALGLHGKVQTNASLSFYEQPDGDRYARFAASDRESVVIEDESSNGELDFGIGEAFSIRTRIRTSQSSTGAIVAKDSAGASWWLRVEDGYVKFAVEDGPWFASVTHPTRVNDGLLWHDIRAERNTQDQQLRLSVDGVYASHHDSTQTCGSLANAQAVRIGAHNQGTKNYFNGDIASVHVDDGIASWDFEGFTAIPTHLQKGSSIPYELGIVETSTSTRLSFYREDGDIYAKFVASDKEAIMIADDLLEGALDFGKGEEFEIHAKIRTSQAGKGVILSKDDASGAGWWLRVENGQARFAVQDGAVEDGGRFASVTHPTVVNDGSWHDVKVVRDSRLRIWVDDDVNDPNDEESHYDYTQDPCGSLANDEPVRIGGFNTRNDMWFNGDIDFVRIERPAFQ